ncbi:hypothetical protein [Nostoc sp. NOS(2021)]|uniref:hypothetical protein n=1 Tax=Nostoc sp. NOS(2021) TaxID=2815407 RepID=UPI0025E0FDD6|nr:hypothetical protein [Nostoc sp. NOS(2021)]
MPANHQGRARCHWCQLNVKTSLEPAFRDCLVPSLRLGMPVVEAPPLELRQSHNEVHFQPLAGNEVLKGFGLNLTPMAFRPIPQDGIIYFLEFPYIN